MVKFEISSMDNSADRSINRQSDSVGNIVINMKELNFKEAPSIGILMTDLRNELKTPYFFTMIFCDWMINKKWGQRFLEL